jgi:fused signal recognition particle receptor
MKKFRRLGRLIRMFGKLKDKLKGALSVFSKNVEDVPVEEVEKVIEEGSINEVEEKEIVQKEEVIAVDDGKSESVKEVEEDIKEKEEKLDVSDVVDENVKSVEEVEETVESPKVEPVVVEEVKKEEPIDTEESVITKESKVIEEPEPKEESELKEPDTIEEPVPVLEEEVEKKEKDIVTEEKEEKVEEKVEKKKEKVKKEEINKVSVEEKKDVDIEAVKEDKPAKVQKGFFGKLKKSIFGDKEEKEEQKKEKEIETEIGTVEEKVEEKKTKEKKEKVIDKKETKIKPEEVIEEDVKKDVDEVNETTVNSEKPKEKSFFGKIKQSISTKTISADKFENMFWDLEVVLLENNVSVEVIDKIKEDLKLELVDKPLPRNVLGKIQDTLKNTLNVILSHDKVNILQNIKNKEGPYVIAFFGINGAGKTTSIAKLTHYLKENGHSVVLAACDTFRAAAIQQLEEHANRLGVKMIKQDYGSDAAAVAFDAIKYAEKNKVDVVLIDTAGRLHSNTNLMAELDKIIRVTSPDLKVFVGESITGNDCVEQASKFNELVEMDGAILTKADVDEKGGAPLSISYVIGKPILFLGVGQDYNDLEEFDKDVILKRLGF